MQGGGGLSDCITACALLKCTIEQEAVASAANALSETSNGGSGDESQVQNRKTAA